MPEQSSLSPILFDKRCQTSFQPIPSAINTPSYKLAKFLVPLLTTLKSKDFTIKDSSSFAQELSTFDCTHYSTSFDIESLFTMERLCASVYWGRVEGVAGRGSQEKRKYIDNT